MLKKEILQKIDGLFIYSASMPDKTKIRFISHLERIKEEIGISLSDLNVTKKEEAPVQVSPVLQQDMKHPPVPKTELKKPKKKELITTQQTLTSLTSYLIPKLTNKGKEKIDDLSTPINLYTVLKLIDEKSSIWDLYTMYSYHFKNYLEFLNVLYELEAKKYLNFIKIENLAPNISWIKIGEFLIECNVIHEINVTNAANYKRTNKDMKIGEAMLELRFIPEEYLNIGLKLQKWISEIPDKSIFIDGIFQAENYSNKNTKTITKNASNILDYIIPVFGDSTKAFLPNDTKDKNFITKLSIINEKSSLLKIFEENKQLFDNKIDFFNFILKLDSQELLSYKKNDEVESRDTWIRFGELCVALELVTEKQVEDTFPYRQKNSHRNIYIGEALVELNYLSHEHLEGILKIQRWLNTILARVSYENAMITAIKEVIEDHFKTPTEIGRFRKMAFQKPLQNMVCITYTISGKLNGQIYYIFDRSFVENLSKKLMASYGVELQKLDESIISELCNIVTGSSLTKLSKIGIFSETNVPKINMENEVIIANRQVISVLPLMNENGRFVVGFQLKG